MLLMENTSVGLPQDERFCEDADVGERELSAQNTLVLRRGMAIPLRRSGVRGPLGGACKAAHYPLHWPLLG